MEGATIHLAARTKSQLEEVSHLSCKLVLPGHHLQTQLPFSVRQSLAHGHRCARLLHAACPGLKQAVCDGVCPPLMALVLANTNNQSRRHSHLASLGTATVHS